MTIVAPPPQAPPSRRGSKKAHRRGRHGLRPVRRWPKRAFIALGSLLLIIVMLVVAAIVYVNYRLDQVKTANCATCVAAAPGQPFTVLLIGSDSRQFVDNSSQASQFGSAQSQTGQRSDVTIVARVVPATHQVLLMSIPRDLWVNIPGNIAGISGMNRINAAFNNGPSLLVQTIENDLGVPINDFAEVNFPGLEGVVNSLGGLYLDFPMPVKDSYSGLNITKTGCQLVTGAQALSLVRSRHLYYEKNGIWNADVQSDFSRIQRQDVFFKSLITRSHQKITDPFSINAFIGAIASDITVNKDFKGQLLGLAEGFHSVGANALKTETLPTTEFTTSGGAQVLQTAKPYASSMIGQFKAFGTTSSGSKSTTTTNGSAKVPASSIRVHVLNGDGTSGLAATVSGELARAGYTVTGKGDASSYSYVTSQVQYAAGHQAVAEQFAASISGGAQTVVDPALTGSSIIFTVGSTFAGVQSAAPGTGTHSTTSTTQPPPPNVVTNTQTEPWNPTPCAG